MYSSCLSSTFPQFHLEKLFGFLLLRRTWLDKCVSDIRKQSKSWNSNILEPTRPFSQAHGPSKGPQLSGRKCSSNSRLSIPGQCHESQREPIFTWRNAQRPVWVQLCWRKAHWLLAGRFIQSKGNWQLATTRQSSIIFVRKLTSCP